MVFPIFGQQKWRAVTWFSNQSDTYVLCTDTMIFINMLNETHFFVNLFSSNNEQIDFILGHQLDKHELYSNVNALFFNYFLLTVILNIERRYAISMNFVSVDLTIIYQIYLNDNHCSYTMFSQRMSWKILYPFQKTGIQTSEIDFMIF